MKKLYLFVLASIMMLFSACHDRIWDAIDDLDARVAKLEELCKEMNTNISSLQTIVSVLQENDYITGITPIEKGDKVIGYTITFGKHDPITIYNGVDGKDGINGTNGQNGIDGYTPILGIAKDTDGVYYWTLDGEWLLDADGNKLRVTGRDGKDGQDGQNGKDGVDGKDGADGEDGKDGQNGTNGVDGKDGVTPQLKIENNYWYISYDNEATWTELGKAVGEDGRDGINGSNGKDGQNGDSMFSSVTYDEKNAYLTLANGTVLTIPLGEGVWEKLEDLEERIAKLEALCKEMNTNIVALQTIVTALQNNDYITGVAPITKDGKTIGYVISFAKNDPITIYNGEDGKDGANGTNGQDGKDGVDGYTPILGVAKDTDGVYYWTLDGQWLLDADGNKLRVTGRDGKDGEDGIDGENGQNGTNGTNGVDGKDGITPKLKIENGYWYISYDNEKTWTELGKAVGEDGKDGIDGEDGKNGQPGKDGVDGDSMFSNVTYDENNVYFILTNGTTLVVPKGGASSEVNPSDIIKFEDLNVRLALIDLGVDTDNDREISYAEASSVMRLDFSSYKFASFREFKYFINIQAVSFYNTEVRELIFPENGVDSILDNAFQKVLLKELIIPEGTIYVGKKAFYNSPIENLVLPNSIVTIGEEAFVGCAMRVFNMPLSTTFMYDGTLKNCVNLEEFIFHENYDGEPFLFGFGFHTNSSTPSFVTSPPKKIYWNVINYDKTFKGSKPNNSSTNAADYVFYGLAASPYYNNPYTPKITGNTSIEFVIFGDKVKVIPPYICAYLESIIEINIPNSVTSIGDYAFRSCPSVTSITIGNSVTSIGDYAFAGCDALKYLYCKAITPPTLNYSPIPNTVTIIYVPRSSVEEYKIIWSNYADKIVGYDF